jgi:hypothetical protein
MVMPSVKKAQRPRSRPHGKVCCRPRDQLPAAAPLLLSRSASHALLPQAGAYLILHERRGTLALLAALLAFAAWRSRGGAAASGATGAAAAAAAAAASGGRRLDAGGGRAPGGGLAAWLAGASRAAAAGPEPAVVSTVRVHAAPNGNGVVNKYYYAFENAQLSKDKITVFYGAGFSPPYKEHWVDFISGNTTAPLLPTMLVVKGDKHGPRWHHLRVEYVKASEQQPECATWVDKTAYLLQVRCARGLIFIH